MVVGVQLLKSLLEKALSKLNHRQYTFTIIVNIVLNKSNPYLCSYNISLQNIDHL